MNLSRSTVPELSIHHLASRGGGVPLGFVKSLYLAKYNQAIAKHNLSRSKRRALQSVGKDLSKQKLNLCRKPPLSIIAARGGQPGNYGGYGII